MLQSDFKTPSKPNICQQLLTTSPNNPIVSAVVNGQAVRQAAVPFAFMIRHTLVSVRVADVAAVRVVISIGTTRVSRSPSMLLHAAAVAVVMLLNTAAVLFYLLLLRPSSPW